MLLSVPHHAIWEGAVLAVFERAAEVGYPHAVDRLGQPAPLAASLEGCRGVIGPLWNKDYVHQANGALLSGRFPVVNLSNGSGPLPEFANFLSDDVAIGRLAADHLARRGHRTLLAISVPGVCHSEERMRGFRERAAELGLAVTHLEERFPGHEVFRTPHGFIAASAEILDPYFLNLPFDAAIFGTSDWLARMAQAALKLRHPERIQTTGVLGVDNVPQDHYSGRIPGVSSIEPGFRRAARAAFDWIIDVEGAWKAGAELPLRRFAPVGVVERGSTAGPACADPGTAQLARWAWGQMRRGHVVDVMDLARRQRVTRKTIARWFSTHLGMSPSDYLERLRLDLARELLRNTRLPILEVSLRCGYAKQDVLSRAIRRAEGCTPMEFRARFGPRAQAEAETG